MKKRYSLLIIIMSIFALTLFAQANVSHSVSELSRRLSAAETELERDNFARATPLCHDCITALDEKEPVLCAFIRNETINALTHSLYGMECYAKEENRTEALAELSRARSQLDAMRELFFRWL